MRFYEFATTQYIQAPATTNVPHERITTTRSVPVIPDAVKRRQAQQAKAAEIARSANQIQLTKHDLEMAWIMYGQAQSAANRRLRQRANIGKKPPSD